jgi:hypothetical protein
MPNIQTMRYIISISIFSIMLFESGCFLLGLTPPCDDESSVYEFKIECQLYPKLDTFTMDDTIWVECRVPAHMYDNVSGDTYYWEEYDHKFYINFFIFGDSSQSPFTGANNFEVIDNIGSAQIGTFSITRMFRINLDSITEDLDSLRVGFIPKKAGTYCFNFSQDISYTFAKGIFKDECAEELIYFYFNLNQGDTTINYGYYAPYDTIFSREEMMESGAYAFRVVE